MSKVINDDVQRGLSQTKYGATWLMFLEMKDILNFSGISNKYFERSPQWISQRIHGHKVHDKRVSLTPEEYDKLANSLRDIANNLIRFADNIDSAEYYDINQ